MAAPSVWCGYGNSGHHGGGSGGGSGQHGGGSGGGSGNTVSCYDCHSGSGSYSYQACPVNGRLDSGKLSSVNCDSFCFSRTSKWEKGVIYRGCSALFPSLPKNLKPGCFDFQGETWCLCSGDHCNTDDMGNYIHGSGGGNGGGSW
ncbi:hypothetical protein Ahia01_000206800, partial [Argonauta hians]